MRPMEQLDGVGGHEMSLEEFEGHSILCCVVSLSDSAGIRVESIDAPGYVGLAELRGEITRSFAAQGFTRARVSALTDGLVRQMTAQRFDGDVWYTRLPQAKSVVFVKSEAALGFSAREVIRCVYSSACSEALQDEQSDTARGPGGAANLTGAVA